MATGQLWYGAPPAARPSRTGFWIAVGLATLFFICTVVLFFLWLFTALGAVLATGMPAQGHRYVKQTVMGSGEDEILLLSVRGLVTGEPQRELIRTYPGTVQSVREQLDEVRKDSRIKAVILAIDSPGGAITACDVVYNEVAKFRRSGGKPVVAYLGDTAASGGYYIACGADSIVAHPTCLTGSIGVMMPIVSLEGLFSMIGVKVDPVISGPRKDIGAIYRDLADQERQYLQTIVDELHVRFVGVVRESLERRGHKLTEQEIKELTNGAPFTGTYAAQKGLVDETGYLEEAVQKAQRLARLASAKVVAYVQPRGFLDALLAPDVRAGPSSAEAAANPELAILGQYPRFFYLWTAGRGILLSSHEAPRP